MVGAREVLPAAPCSHIRQAGRSVRPLSPFFALFILPVHFNKRTTGFPIYFGPFLFISVRFNVPEGKGADIASVKVLLNGAETEFEADLERTADYKGFLAPYGAHSKFLPFSITLPASGVNRVSVVTAPNAAGISGRAEFEVVFKKTFDAPGGQPVQTIAYDVLLPASFSPTAKETISLALPGLPSSDALEETANDSRTFVSIATGAIVVVSPTFQPTVQVDNLPCVISIPSLVTGGGSTERPAPCVETGANTLRFAYRLDIPAQSRGASYEWTLASVDMGQEAYQGLTRPVTFSGRYYGASETSSLKWQGETFPFSPAVGSGEIYASTSVGKPLIGFFVPKENEAVPDSREFIYYDHTSQTLKRIPIAATVTDLPYQLKIGEFTTGDIKLPVCGWQLLDLDLQPSEGLLPVSIESLIDLADGDTTVEIPDESQGIIEISGRKPGEVVVMFSPEETDDRFDLTVPGEQPKITLRTRNAALVAAGDSRYRSQEKLVIYSSAGEDGPTTLTDAQWQALKALGYLAVHNAAPVIASTEDLAWAMKQFGSPHPPEDLPMGTSGVTDPRKAQFYRFEGYQDHHVFNQYDMNPPKKARWTAIFGKDFDVDEFTVPVNTKYHQKTSKRITDEWEAFLSDSFDGSHQLKPGVDIQQLRRDTLNKMREINGRWGIDTSRLRPYPQIIKNGIDNARPALCNRLIANKGRLGCSLDKLKVIDEMAFGPLLKGANAARNQWWKDTIKKVFKREGKKGIGKVVPILSAAMTVSSVASASIDVNQHGWEEAAAQAVNEQLGLDDIELAREAIRQQFNTGLIAGGTPKPVLTLPNGQVLGMNERTYRCSWGTTGTVHTVDPYVISQIKVFPDGSSKVAATMEVPPFETIIETSPNFVIRDYWPKIGDPSSLYLQAKARAMANTGGNP